MNSGELPGLGTAEEFVSDLCGERTWCTESGHWAPDLIAFGLSMWQGGGAPLPEQLRSEPRFERGSFRAFGSLCLLAPKTSHLGTSGSS